MIRTEADLIINHINHHFIEHHHIIHHQSIIYNILNLSNFSMRKNHSSISTMNMKEIRWPMEGVGDSLILTLIGEAGFLTVTPRFHGYGDVTATYISRSENTPTYIR